MEDTILVRTVLGMPRLAIGPQPITQCRWSTSRGRERGVWCLDREACLRSGMHGTNDDPQYRPPFAVSSLVCPWKGDPITA